MKLEFSKQIFRKTVKISNFMEIRPVGAEFFPHAEGQTDVTKLTVVIRNFANTAKNGICSH